MSIKSKIQALISAANTKTGESDTTLTDAVQTLVDGYGQGGGGADIAPLKFVKGTMTPSQNASELTFPCGDITTVVFFEAKVVDYDNYISADNNGMGLGYVYYDFRPCFGNRTVKNFWGGIVLAVYNAAFDRWSVSRSPAIDATNQTAKFAGNTNVTFKAGIQIEYVMLGV